MVVLYRDEGDLPLSRFETSSPKIKQSSFFVFILGTLLRNQKPESTFGKAIHLVIFAPNPKVRDFEEKKGLLLRLQQMVLLSEKTASTQ